MNVSVCFDPIAQFLSLEKRIIILASRGKSFNDEITNRDILVHFSSAI